MRPGFSLALFQVDLGWIVASYSEAGVASVSLPEPSAIDALGTLPGDTAGLSRSDDDGPFGLGTKLAAYFRGEFTEFSGIPLDLRSHTEFDRQVWGITRRIPYGETRSYGVLAGQCGRPLGARAIGQAMARNPVPIVVPCHRVIGSDGRLRGFGGGLALKQRMLEIEGVTGVRV